MSKLGKMNLQMYTLIFTLILLYKLILTDKVETTKHIDERECQPNCNNTLPVDCNKFEIELRATMTKCAPMVSPFVRKPKGEGGSISPIDANAIQCGKKLRASLKIFNQGEASIHNQYIIIDHVIDSENGQRVSLLNPYVIVLRQKPLLQLYGLKYKYVVNAEAKEQVINKRNSNFLGCDDLTDHPTCGNIRYNGESIPFSQGFCCSCDDTKNVRRQPRSMDLYSTVNNSEFFVHDFLFNSLRENDRIRNHKETQYDKPLVRFKKSIHGLRDFNDYRNQIRTKSVDHIIRLTPRKLPRVLVVRNDDPVKKFDRNYLRSHPSLTNTLMKNGKINFDSQLKDDIYKTPKLIQHIPVAKHTLPDYNSGVKIEPFNVFDKFEKKEERKQFKTHNIQPEKILDIDENKENMNKFNQFQEDDQQNDNNEQSDIPKDSQNEEPVNKLYEPVSQDDTAEDRQNEESENEELRYRPVLLADTAVDTQNEEPENKPYEEPVFQDDTDEDTHKDEAVKELIENEKNIQSDKTKLEDDYEENKNAFNNYENKHKGILKQFHGADIQSAQRTDEDEKLTIDTENERNHLQTRGGQNCDDKWLPKRADPSSYSDSAHCLRFSKLWYGVYQISEPVLEHSLFIRIFEKREKQDGSTTWVDLTQGRTVNVGSFQNKNQAKNSEFSITYENLQKTGESLAYSLDPKMKRLLIPQYTGEDDRNPETQCGATEFLVVDRTDLEPSGERCNAAGVGYSAFYNQPDRCMVSKDTCLQNQPRHLWRQDKDTCDRLQSRGKFFLKNFAIVPDDALRTTKNGDASYLAIQFTDKIKSTIEIDVKADDNIIFRSIAIAQITEVYVESLSVSGTTITMKIHNNGLISNVFYPRLADCPLEFPADWSNMEGSPTLIPPQHHFTFTFRLLGYLPSKNIYCTVEALNSRNEIVAVRRIRIVKRDRCICAWHCLCACYETTGLGCIPMAMEHYGAAGFIGSMPLTTNMVKVGSLEKAMFGLFYFLFLLIIILLLMGLTKALIGFFCYVPIGIWGLDMLIGIEKLDRYYEYDLQCISVKFDDEGWPVHPETNERTVRVVDIRVEFCLNVIFFFTYPVMLLLLLIRKFGCPFYSYTGDEDKEHYFEGVSTVIYTKCPDEINNSGSGSDNMFDFMDDSSKEGYCTNTR